MKRWAPIQALTVQHGLGIRAKKNPNTGESVAGPETLPDDDLAKNRTDPHLDLLAHSLCDDWHKERSADLSQVTVPLLDRKSTRLNSSHTVISYAVFCLKKKKKKKKKHKNNKLN